MRGLLGGSSFLVVVHIDIGVLSWGSLHACRARKDTQQERERARPCVNKSYWFFLRFYLTSEVRLYLFLLGL